MGVKKAPEAITTKTGETVTLNYCRKCMQNLPAKEEFYECTDAGFIDSNGLMSVCKDCIQKIYDILIAENGSLEKTIHKLCISMNMRFSNEAVSATKTHINTLLENGKHVNAIFSIYKMKLTATKKSMDKRGMEDDSYEDVGTVFTSELINTKEAPIPVEVLNRWGKNLPREDIEYLEMEYANFKSTHPAVTAAEVTLLKRVCYTLLDIERARANADDTDKLVKQLQDLMKNLAISPNAINEKTNNKGAESFGLWISDIEENEPAQWLKSDPRGDMYRDVGNVEEYFQKFFVRPMKNFIMGSKDFNIDDAVAEDDELGLEETVNYRNIDDGEAEV